MIDTSFASQRTILALFTALLMQSLAVAGEQAKASSQRQPNVVILFTDDQGTLDANCYGSQDLYTPAIDRLAETGVRFTQAYAHTVCCPARAMLMTGRYPHRGGISNWAQGDAKSAKGRNLAREEITIAEALKTAGYKTGLFGKWHLGAHPDHQPTEQGFDESFGILGGFIHNYNHFFLHGAGFHDLHANKEETFAEGKYFPDLMTARALAFVDKHHDEPFLLYVAFNLPHYPMQPDAKFEERYKELPMPRQAYAKMVSTVDDRIGQIIARLEQLKLRENTIVIYMSDNGHSAENATILADKHKSGLAKGTYYGANGGGGNTGKWRGHKAEFYEGGIRVPAIISWPAKLPQGVVRDQAITAMDWLPTLVDLLHIAPPQNPLDGQSIVPLINSATTPSHNKVLHWAWQNHWAVRDGDWKLIAMQGKLRIALVLYGGCSL